MSDKQHYLTDEDVECLRELVRMHKNRRHNPALRPFDEEPDLQPPEVYVALTPMGGIPALGGSGTDVDAVATVCEIYRLTPSSGTDPGAGLQDAGFTRPIYNLYGAWGANLWVKVTKDKWGTWWTDQVAGGGGGNPSDGILGELQITDGNGNFVNTADWAVLAGAQEPIGIGTPEIILNVDSSTPQNLPWLEVFALGVTIVLADDTAATGLGRQFLVTTGPALNPHIMVHTANTSGVGGFGNALVHIGGAFGVSNDTITIGGSARISIGLNAGSPGDSIGFFGVTPVIRQVASNDTTGFTANSGANVLLGSTFASSVGSSVYTISDIVAALKKYGLLPS